MDFDLAAIFAELQAPEGPATETVSANEYADLMAMLDTPVQPQAAKGEGMSANQRQQKRRAKIKTRQIENIAILDFETDPFDNVEKSRIFPFLAVLYSDNFEPIVIWDEDEQSFVGKVIAEITALPESYTIYAHNGGKFDYMFLINRLRGSVSFKGRGIMRAEIGNHEIRDSFHIIPDKLANFKKDHIDYELMKKKTRKQYRQAIIDYCISDCRYLLEIVKGFAGRFGMKLSIGQAAMMELRKHYKFETVSETTDEYLRQWFFGGRVECLNGMGKFDGSYKLYDVNSMYPYVMATYDHPIGSHYHTRTGNIGPDTFFLDLTCNSRGAFVHKAERGETHAPHGRYRFRTTIHEYNVALKHGLISDIEIHSVIDCVTKTNFIKFIAPIYNERQHVKARLKELAARGMRNTHEWNEAVKEDMFLKFLLNNSWGKFAQNPRNYKEHYLTDPGERPPADAGDDFGMMPATAMPDYWIWERPSPSDRYNNVGTGASVTGAARADLLDALCNATDPIYCDTDSLICTDLANVKLHPTDLGAWDIEKELSQVIVAGKKLYSYTETINSINPQLPFVKSKGASGLKWQQMLNLLNGGEELSTSFGVTLTKNSRQYYMTRRIHATAPSRMDPDGKQSFWRCTETREPLIPDPEHA